ncbi:DegV family protein [Aerococcaceae bacterium WGS1372]
MKTAYIIDSSASLNDQLLNHPDVYVMNLEITWGDEIYPDTTDEAELKKFYQLLVESKELPRTNQPKQGDLISTYEEIVNKGYTQVVVITLASVISGTFNTSSMVSEAYSDKLDIRLIDSKGTSFIEEHLLATAIELQKQGFELDEIEKQINKLADQCKIYVLIEDLNAIVKGGRLSAVGGLIGSALKIKPILEFDDEGYVEVFEKVRTTNRVYKRYVKLVGEAIQQFPQGIRIALAHGDCEDEALKVKAMIEKKYPGLEYRIGYLTPILGTHGGKDSLGLGIMPKLLTE